MRWMTDYHGVLSTHPQLFSEFTGELFVLTASHPNKKYYIEKVLRKHNIKTKDILMMPGYLSGDRVQPKGFWIFQNEWKLEQIKLYNPDFYFDDEEYVIREVYVMRRQGFCQTTPLHIVNQEGYIDDAIESMSIWKKKKGLI